MPAVIPHIIDQHAEEAAFLWLLRNAAVHAPHYDVADLAKLDDRVEAHLDGLRIAADYGWQVVSDNLQAEEAGEVFTAAFLALEGNSIERIKQVYETVEKVPETLPGLVSALGWVAPQNLQGKVNGLLVSDKPLWRRVGIRACAIHRVDPGKFLEQAIEDEDLALKSCALRTAGEIGRVDLKPQLLALLDHADQAVSFWAAWSSVLLGDRGAALTILRRDIESNSRFCDRAMQAALPVMDGQTVKSSLKVLAENQETLRQAIKGVGFSGDPRYVPWLIQHMQEPKLARVAGESFSFICGVDLAYQDLECDLPEEAAAGPNENPEDEKVALDPDEDLPCPDANLVLQWWQDNSHRFNPEYRYIYGQVNSEQQCQTVLFSGTQRLRQLAAMILALRQPRQKVFETRAPGKRQQALLGSKQ
ncbi:TIGR02270 family protein [Methylomarinum vadi]|uniref:TIGR02270 family protein n=1 Tax=Methylomarinum vadi TaxID=438855 RepID=UPI0004DEEF2E|nr:TIGR02270 family protein [Methylomarinum vadi]